MRGQAAIEYLLIFSAMMAIIAVVTYSQLLNPYRETAAEELYLSQARHASDEIAFAINTVYGNGKGAVKTVGVLINHAWELQLIENTSKVRVSIETPSRTENVESTLEYVFDSSLSLPAGAYTVIAEWPENEENLILDGYKIYIRINPGGE